MYITGTHTIQEWHQHTIQEWHEVEIESINIYL